MMQKAKERQQLTTRLLDSVKQCQIQFGGKTELATEADSRVCCLCSAWEVVLQHGLKHNSKALSTLKHVTELTGLSKIGVGIPLLNDIKHMETEPCFWNVIARHLSKHELHRYMLLKHVHTESGRGRAWLRSTLNEHSLEKYMLMIVGNEATLGEFYEDWAFMRDQECGNVLPATAAGLGSILFAISIDNENLNRILPATGLVNIIGSSNLPLGSAFVPREEEDQMPVIASESVSPQVMRKKEKKKKRKKMANIVCFDDDDKIGSYSTSPASSVSSSWSKTSKSKLNASVVVTASATTLKTTSGFKLPPESVPVASIGKTLNSSKINSDITCLHNENAAVIENTKTLFSFTEDSVDMVKSNDQSEGLVETTPENSIGPNEQLDEVMKSFSNILDTYPLHSPMSSPDVSTEAPPGDQDSDLMLPPVKQTVLSSSENDRDANKKQTTDGSSSEQMRSDSMKIMQSESATSLPSVGTSVTSTASESSSSYHIGSGNESLDVTMTPLNRGKASNGDAVCTCGIGEDLVSGDSSEVPSCSEETETNGFAVSLTQKGFVDSLRTQGDGSHAPEPVFLSHNSMTTTELKEAMIAMMTRKDEVEEQNSSLRALLDSETQRSATLRLEQEELKKSSESRQDRDSQTIKTISRENELLKHQLKKYVNAVQMLRRQGARDEELNGIHLDDIQPAVPPAPSVIDYSHEASEYEKKLIQVAEMHGELMEFNETLQKQLMSRESHLKRLTDELIGLRGPLPGDYHSSEDSISLSSEMGATGGPLINIWIPTAFQRGTSSDTYHVYQVYVRIRDEEWNVYRRYSEFHKLHMHLKNQYPVTATFKFPSKKAVGNKQLKCVESRRVKLQMYLRLALNAVQTADAELGSHGSRQRLVELLPFFGEAPVSGAKSKANKSKVPQDTNGPHNGPETPESHQYMGL